MTPMDDSKPIYQALCQYCGDVIYYQQNFEEWQKEFCSLTCERRLDEENLFRPGGFL